MDYSIIIRWAAPILGILIIYSAIVFKDKITNNVSGDLNETNKGKPYLWSALITLILAVISTFCIIKWMPNVPSLTVAAGWLAVLLLCVLQTVLEKRKKISHSMFVSAGMIAFALAMAYVSISPIYHNTMGISAEDTFLIAALSLWIPVLFYNLAGGTSNSASKNIPHPVSEFRAVSFEILFLSAAALSTAITIASYRYSNNPNPGYLYPLGVFTVSAFFGLVIMPFIGFSSAMRKSGITAVGFLIFIIGTALAAYFLSTTMLQSANPFYCIITGLAAAILIYLTAKLRKSNAFASETSLAIVLILIAASILSFRWMTGYGAALCAVGITASIPLIIQLRSNNNESEISDINMVQIILSSGAFIIITALLRLFTERMGMGRSGIDITEPYPLLGLALGGIFPLLMSVMLNSTKDFGSNSGKSAVRATGIFLVVLIVSASIMFFWRAKAAGGFIAGLAISELYLILQMLFNKDYLNSIVFRVNHTISVGSALIITMFSLPLMNATGAITRANKITVLIVLVAIMFIASFIYIMRKVNSLEKQKQNNGI